MTTHVPVRGLFETHLTVRDLRRSVTFYREIVGLPLALDVPGRNAAFFWVGGAGRSMLGLWSLGSAPMGLTLHLAFEVSLEDLLAAPTLLSAQGITPLSFDGVETTEPSVLGWMPAAALYFHDPDGHLLEYLTMLDEEPRPDVGVIPWSVWRAQRTPERLVEAGARGAEVRGQPHRALGSRLLPSRPRARATLHREEPKDKPVKDDGESLDRGPLARQDDPNCVERPTMNQRRYGHG